MIEPIMYFGIGFLVAALIGLVVVPLVHGRAVRLTMRRLEAATPLSMAEIQADKDQDRKSTRLNSSHQIISYAVFCLKKKNKHLIEFAQNRLRIAAFFFIVFRFADQKLTHGDAVHREEVIMR